MALGWAYNNKRHEIFHVSLRYPTFVPLTSKKRFTPHMLMFLLHGPPLSSPHLIEGFKRKNQPRTRFLHPKPLNLPALLPYQQHFCRLNQASLYCSYRIPCPLHSKKVSILLYNGILMKDTTHLSKELVQTSSAPMRKCSASSVALRH